MTALAAGTSACSRIHKLIIEGSQLISRARSQKDLCICKSIVRAFRKSVRSSIEKLRNHPEPSQRKQRRSKEKMSATETKNATVRASETVDEVFHEAMRSYEKALKSGIQLQEESVNLWKDLLTKLGSPEEYQAKLDSMTANAFPKARKRMEEFVETFDRTSNETIDLFEKTLGVYQATSVTDAQRRVQDLVETSLNAMRVNVHSALNTNSKIVASWKELVDRFGPAVK